MENYQELSITSTEMDGEPDIPNSQSIISKQNEHDEIDNLLEPERHVKLSTENSYMDVKAYRFHPISLLTSNKQLSILENHQNNNITVPRGLLPEVKSTSRLTEGEKSKWRGFFKDVAANYEI